MSVSIPMGSKQKLNLGKVLGLSQGFRTALLADQEVHFPAFSVCRANLNVRVVCDVHDYQGVGS